MFFGSIVDLQEAIKRFVAEAMPVQNLSYGLLKFFNRVHDLSGYTRPQGLYGFPAGRPSPDLARSDLQLIARRG